MQVTRLKTLNDVNIGMLYVTQHWRRQLWGTRVQSPLKFQQFIFPVDFKAAQSLTAALCGYLSKDVCILRQQLL